jgi:hypothetical protein
MSSTPQNYTPPPPHTLPADAAEFLASLPEVEQQLHKLAAEKLGSSYFMDRTHSYKNWKKKQAAAAAAPSNP